MTTHRTVGLVRLPLTLTLVGIAGPTWAQSVNDNAIASANDAFGSSVGNERIGIYSVDDVRGFSPVDAGNGRIEGLYFAPVDKLPNRLVKGSKVRVGITALGYPFPAPTGIVDYDLTESAIRNQLSLSLERGQFGSLVANLDGQFLLAPDMGVYAGATVRRQNRHEGGDFKSHILSGGLAWQPYNGASLNSFYAYTRTYADEAAPSIFPGGDFLPPRITRRAMIGQSWSDRDNSHAILGALAKLPFGQWQLDAGLFHAEKRVDANFTDLFTAMRPDGTTANRVMVVDVANRDTAMSGEVRLSRTFGTAALAHRVTASFRGKQGRRRFGGAQRIALGASTLAYADERPEPVFAFGSDDRDHVEQSSLGLSYSVTKPGLFAVDFAIAASRYSKTIAFAAAATPKSVHNRPVTGSITGSFALAPGLTAYGGYVRGFEEVSPAPANAANRGSAPPAIRTRQTDAGFRYALAPGINLVGGLFAISKPYYNIGNNGIYHQLGSSSNRGVEVSLAGSLRPGLSVVLGTVALDARISGQLVSSGAIGPRPIGTVRRRSILNIDWRLDGGNSPLSFDLSAESLSKRVGNASNRLMAPARETIDLGLRYRFDLASAKALLRLQVANLFDDYGWQVSSNGAFQYSAGRRLLAELRMDLP